MNTIVIVLVSMYKRSVEGTGSQFIVSPSTMKIVWTLFIVSAFLGFQVGYFLFLYFLFVHILRGMVRFLHLLFEVSKDK